MLQSSSGQSLTLGKLRALILAGGDAGAKIVEGGEESAAARGQHLLLRYMTPLYAYYKQWHYRALSGYVDWVVSSRSSLPTLQDRLSLSIIKAGATTATLSSAAKNSHEQIAFTLFGTALPNYQQRFDQHKDFIVPAVLGNGLAIGEGRYKVEHDRARMRLDKIAKLYQAAGKSAVDSIGATINSAQQVMEMHAADRKNTQAAVNLADAQARAAEQDRAERRSAQGTLLGVVARVGLRIATGGVL